MTRRIARSLGDSWASCVYGLAMWSISLVMTDCPLSGRGQSHVSNFYILDLENFVTASRRCTSDINVDGQLVDSTYDGRARRGWMHKFIIRWPTVTLWLHYFDWFWNFRTSCTYSVMQQLARIRLTRRVMLPVYDSRATCESPRWHWLQSWKSLNIGNSLPDHTKFGMQQISSPHWPLEI